MISVRSFWKAFLPADLRPEGLVVVCAPIGLALERPLSAAFVRQPGYGTRASTLILVGHDGNARIHERSFDAAGRCTGETRLALPPT